MKNENLIEAKKQANNIIQSVLAQEVEKLLKENDFSQLKKQLNEFENDPYNEKNCYIQFDDCGLLESTMILDLPEWLSNQDQELIEAVFQKEFEYLSIYYSRTNKQWEACQCLGEAVIVNWSADRNHYTIHSNELKLKIDKVEDENHAYLLIEQAMRKAGYFPNIVEVDSRYGQFCRFLTTGMGNWQDKTIESRLKKYQG